MKEVMCLKKILRFLCFVAVICFISVVSFTETNIIFTNVDADIRPTIILDAGHAALENTIKTPKNHRQANVEIIPKTRLNSGFSPFLNCLISRSIINLQIQKIQ